MFFSVTCVLLRMEYATNPRIRQGYARAKKFARKKNARASKMSFRAIPNLRAMLISLGGKVVWCVLICGLFALQTNAEIDGLVGEVGVVDTDNHIGQPNATGLPFRCLVEGQVHPHFVEARRNTPD